MRNVLCHVMSFHIVNPLATCCLLSLVCCGVLCCSVVVGTDSLIHSPIHSLSILFWSVWSGLSGLVYLCLMQPYGVSRRGRQRRACAPSEFRDEFHRALCCVVCRHDMACCCILCSAVMW